MGFVHNEQTKAAIPKQGLQRSGQQHFGCKVQDGLFAVMDGVQALLTLLVGNIGVQEGGAMHAAGFQLGDLILHQSNQRRDHDSDSFVYLRQIDTGYLIEHRFACAGGSGQEHIGVVLIVSHGKLALPDDGADDLALTDLLCLRPSGRVFVEVQHPEICIHAPILLEDGTVAVDGFRLDFLLLLCTVQGKCRTTLRSKEGEHIVSIVCRILYPLHRHDHAAFQPTAQDVIGQHHRGDIMGNRCLHIRESGLLLLVEEQAADVFALVLVERGQIIALIQFADTGIIMAEQFGLRRKIILFAFKSLVQYIGICRRDAAGHISREGVVVHYDELRIKHCLGVLYVLKDGQHFLINADRHAFLLHHQALHQLTLGRINFRNADGAILVQNLACRQNRIFAMCQPADIGRYKTTKKENHIFACIAGNEFFGVLLKILLCIHDTSSCTFYTSSNVLSP